MSQNQGDFTPVVKGGYKSDGPFHIRNWKALSDFLRTNFVTNDRLADGSVGSAKIEDLAVTDAKIESLAVDKLTAGSLQADVVIGSTIKTADTGQRVEIDSNGIRLTDGTNDQVNLPISGTSTFRGGITATSLQATDPTLRGDSTIDGGGILRFSTGVADPTSAPTISWTYNQIALSGITALRGVEYDGTNNRLLGCYVGGDKVYGFPLAGGVRDFTYSAPWTPYGVTTDGTKIYVVMLNGSNVELYKLNTAAGVPTTVALANNFSIPGTHFTNFDHLAGMTYDGTDIYVAYVKNNDDVVVNQFDTSLNFVAQFTLAAGFETGDRKIFDIEYQNTAGGLWWIVWGNTTTGAYQVSAFTAALAALPAEDFVLPGNSQGICYSGAEFITTPSNGQYYRKHSNWRSAQTVEHVKYTWRDTVGGFESAPSKQSFVTYVQRAFLRVSWPGFPGTADAVRVYFLENGVSTNPGSGTMFRQGTETTSSQTYSTYNGAGAADPGATTFPAATPARLVLPVKAGAPASPETGEIYFDSGTSKARVWDGAAWNNLW